MNYLVLAALVAISVRLLNMKAQRQRVALLGSFLAQHQIEKLMENLMDGYLRALSEDDPARREQVWQLLDGTGKALAQQFRRFAEAFAAVSNEQARTSRLPVALPGAVALFPRLTFDMREVLLNHARGIEEAADNTRQLSPRDRAYLMTAELLLMQHSCHWYCKSKTVASARLLARHKTPYAQALASVSPQTRQAYRTMVGG